VLVSVKGLVDLISQQTTMPECHPRGAVIRLQIRHVLVVVDCKLVVASSCTELSQLAEVLESQQSGGVCLGVLLHTEIRNFVLLPLLGVFVGLLQVGILVHQLLVLDLEILLGFIFGDLLHLKLRGWVVG
jgi:hypothetical protein